LDGETTSTNANLQLGAVEKLSEIWSVTATAGYSRANDKIDFTEEEFEFTQYGLVRVLIPVTLKSTQNGSVYAVSLNRQTELLSLTVSASRQLVPTGFAFLSRQDAYELKTTYSKSERWSFGGDVRRVSYQQPDAGGTSTNLNFVYFELSATWQWTEHWAAALKATRVTEHYVSPSIGVVDSGVSINLSRQFNWKSLQ
jgi:hypothetical protein